MSICLKLTQQFGHIVPQLFHSLCESLMSQWYEEQTFERNKEIESTNFIFFRLVTYLRANFQTEMNLSFQ